MNEELKEMLEKLERLKKEYQSLFRGSEIPFKELPTSIEQARNQVKFFEAGLRQSKREAAGLSGVFEGLNQQLKANLSEIDKSNTSLGLGKKAYRDIVNTVRQLADEEAGIDKLSFQQLKKLKAKNESALQEMRLAGDRLKFEKGIRTERDIANANLSEYEEALVRGALDNFKGERRALDFVEYRLDLERKVLDTVKLTGGALQGLGNLASSLGLQGFAESLEEIKGGLDDDLRKSIREAAEAKFIETGGEQGNAYKQAKENQKKFSDEILKLEEKRIASGGRLTKQETSRLKHAKNRLSVAEDILEKSEEGIQAQYKNVEATGELLSKFKALGKAAGEFVKQLSDPLFILGSMAKGYLAIDEAATDFERTTGQNVRGTAALNDSLVTSVENMEMMAKFAEQTGMNVNNLFDSYSLARITEAGKLMGVGAEGAAKLAQNLKLSNIPLEDFQNAALQGGKEVVAAGGAGLNLGKVLQDASTTSDAIALSLGNNPKELARAAAEAQRLGMSLDQIDGIANSMLDFESSIQNELEAQLLTGKQINLSKAREAALNNDMAGLAREISENNALSDTFSTSNRIQQEAMAKALGMSRNDLAKMVALDMLRKGISADVVANQMKMSKEQLLQMSVQDKFNTAVGKLQQSLAPVLDIFVSLIDGVADVTTGIGETFGIFSNFVLKVKDTVSEFFGLNDGIDGSNDSLINMSSILKGIGNVIGGILILRFARVLKLVGKLIPSIKTFKNTLTPINKSVSKLLPSFKTLKTNLGSVPRILVTIRKGAKALLGPFLKIGDTIKNIPKLLTSMKSGLSKVTGKTVETAAKGAGSAGAKAGGNIAAKGAGGIMKKVGAKGAMKLGGKALSKLLPGVGLAFALQDFMEGDITGGVINTLAGIASFIPTVGTAISGILTAVDIGRELVGSGDPVEMAKGGVVTQATNIIAGEAGSEAIIPLDKLPSMMPQSAPTLSLEGLNAKFDEIVDKLDELTNIRGDVYIDGYKSGQAIFAASNNLPS